MISRVFQCSSASRKFLNLSILDFEIFPRSFSALQRAENSSISASGTIASASSVSVLFSEPKIPQSVLPDAGDAPGKRFSALQRAENSSIIARAVAAWRRMPFQCSSASRKFRNGRSRGYDLIVVDVSVLFSEPKIPQSNGVLRARRGATEFQCSSASRKFLNASCAAECDFDREVSVLFSEPKIPQ